jgi:hypothetical protein
MIAPPKPPSHDELEALIKEARARQLRRRLLGAAGVAIVAALGLSIYAVVSGGSPSGLAQLRSTAGLATGPRCRSQQLAVGFAFQGTTQTFAGGPTLRNTSGFTCSLPSGRPEFLIVWRGKALRIPVRPGGKLLIAPPLPRAHLLAPGRRAFIPMRWFALPDIGGGVPPPRLRKLCLRQTGQNFRPQVELRYPDGLSLAARATGLSLPDCGPLHSSWMAVGHPMIER